MATPLYFSYGYRGAGAGERGWNRTVDWIVEVTVVVQYWSAALHGFEKSKQAPPLFARNI